MSCRSPHDRRETELDRWLLPDISKEDSLMMGMMLNGIGGMMQGGDGMFQGMPAAMAVMMGFSVLLLLALLALVLLATAWLARDLRSRPHWLDGDSPASTRS
jgi:hypothetical protein